MSREKRTKGVRAWITPSLHEQLELFVQEQGKVVSMSDYLFEVIEEHVLVKSVRRPPMRITQQKIGKRIGEQ